MTARVKYTAATLSSRLCLIIIDEDDDDEDDDDHEDDVDDEPDPASAAGERDGVVEEQGLGSDRPGFASTHRL